MPLATDARQEWVLILSTNEFKQSDQAIEAIQLPARYLSRDIPFTPTVLVHNYEKTAVNAAPLCTEFHRFLRGGTGPLGGHEAAGEVVDIGPGVTIVKSGDRVAVMPQSGC